MPPHGPSSSSKEHSTPDSSSLSIGQGHQSPYGTQQHAFTLCAILEHFLGKVDIMGSRHGIKPTNADLDIDTLGSAAWILEFIASLPQSVALSDSLAAQYLIGSEDPAHLGSKPFRQIHRTLDALEQAIKDRKDVLIKLKDLSKHEKASESRIKDLEAQGQLVERAFKTLKGKITRRLPRAPSNDKERQALLDRCDKFLGLPRGTFQKDSDVASKRMKMQKEHHERITSKDPRMIMLLEEQAKKWEAFQKKQDEEYRIEMTKLDTKQRKEYEQFEAEMRAQALQDHGVSLKESSRAV